MKSAIAKKQQQSEDAACRRGIRGLSWLTTISPTMRFDDELKTFPSYVVAFARCVIVYCQHFHNFLYIQREIINGKNSECPIVQRASPILLCSIDVVSVIIGAHVGDGLC